jgi:dienelactone hydrolase
MQGVVAERVSYATDYGLRVPAIAYHPKQRPAGKMPGIVVVNGHGGDKYSWYALYTGMLYAQAGAVVLTYDPIGEGERNAQRKNGTRQHDRDIEPSEMARRMSGLMITDVMQAVSYLAQRPDTDPKRLAALGYSMGSFVLGITCAVDTRLNSCVLAGGGNLDGPGGYWDSSSKKMCQAIPYQALTFLGDRGAVLYNLHAARGATLIINGTADDVVSVDRRARISSRISASAPSPCTAVTASSTSNGYQVQDTALTGSPVRQRCGSKATCNSPTGLPHQLPGCHHRRR